MTQTHEIFKRYEKKYMLTKTQFQLLYASLEKHMELDQYGRHTICNVYFDTPSFELIRHSLEKPVYKEKLRLRSYGVPNDKDDLVYIELKKKFEGIVYKRRIGMPLADASAYLYHNHRPKQNHQILNEVDWFLCHYHLVPSAYLAYDRMALYGKEDPNLRLTFDLNIRCRNTRIQLEKGDYGSPLLTNGEVLMEVKLANMMPLWMSHLLSDLKVFPISYSKYGTYYKNHLHEKTQREGGIYCA